MSYLEELIYLYFKLKYTIKVLAESLRRGTKFVDAEGSKHVVTISSYEELNYNTQMLEFEKGVQVN